METIANFFFQFGHLFFIVVLPDVGVKFSLFARIHTERCHSLLHVKSLQSRKYLRNPLLFRIGYKPVLAFKRTYTNHGLA